MMAASEIFSPPLHSQQMDFPVEATVHMNNFRDKAEVRRLLRSRGFELEDLGGGRVRVKGCFLELKDVKERLELLIQSETETPPPRSPSPLPAPSPVAISKYYSKNKDEDRPESESRVKPPPSSPSSSYGRPASQDDRDRQLSPRSGEELLVVDADVFRYARQFRKQELDVILTKHDIRKALEEGDESTSITLSGKTSVANVTKLQILLNDLNRSLRTQEVPLKDMSHEGRALLARIKKSKNISGPVLVCFTEDGLRLVGPSKESYELKQRLLGRPVDQSGPRGRSVSRTSRGRSSSLPPSSSRNSGGGAVASPSAGGAAGFSPSKDDGQRGASATLDRSGAPRRRSTSEFRGKKETVKADEKENKCPTQKSALKVFPHLSTKNIKQMFQKRKK